MDDSIICITDENLVLIGSGFVIDRDETGIYIITCGHVVNDIKKGYKVDGKTAKIIKNQYSSGLDLALLYVDNINKIPLTISKDLSSSFKAKVIGYSKLPGNRTKLESVDDLVVKHDVKISRLDQDSVACLKLITSKKMPSGYSGSPIICKQSHKVIGIVFLSAEDEVIGISATHIDELHIVMNSTDFNNYNKAVIGKKIDLSNHDYEDKLLITNELNSCFTSSLKSFADQPEVWVEQVLHTKSEFNKANTPDEEISTENIISNPRNIVITSRQQYGLTSLSHYLINEAWKNEACKSYWLYIDAHEVKPYPSDIDKYVSTYLKKMKLAKDDIECVIIDEVSSEIKDSEKLIRVIVEFFKSKPVIIMKSISNLNYLLEPAVPPDFESENLHLWSLPRNSIREVIKGYNRQVQVGEENAVVIKITSDLEALNIPRTALNCVTMLKIYEGNFDENPVNRTEVIRRVLHLLFVTDHIPRYVTKPDLKDTEFVLGYFCETLIRKSDNSFSRNSFINSLKDFCDKHEIDLEISIIFDILHQNNIIISRNQGFCFKFSYWIFYFAAHRMHHSKEFENFILNNMKYTSYPEIMEFYTGIDRRRDNALTVLIDDISSIRKIVNKKCHFPDDFNIFDLAKWTPTDHQIELMHEETANRVLNSNLPDTVKDQYADRSYDKSRPLNQDIQQIMEDYALLRLMKNVIAGSKSLRNSDYASTQLRHELMQEILLGWEQITKVLVIISPILAKEKYINIDGASFVLTDEFDGTDEENFNQLIQLLPKNIIAWYQDDLFSQKMGMFILNHYESTENVLIKHLLNLLIINKRPNNWDKHIEKCIQSTHKNSFYLLDMFTTLRAEYKYGFISNEALLKYQRLIKMTAAKHDLGIKKVSNKTINKLKDDVLPVRSEKQY